MIKLPENQDIKKGMLPERDGPGLIAEKKRVRKEAKQMKKEAAFRQPLIKVMGFLLLRIILYSLQSGSRVQEQRTRCFYHN